MDWQLFGRSYWRLHRLIDKPYLVFGRRHRIFFHDFPSAVSVARHYFPGNFQAEQAAVLHVHLDNMCSNDPIYKKKLEVLANAFYRAKRRRGEKKKKSKSVHGKPKEVSDLLALCNETLQVQDLLIQISLED